MFCSVAQCPPNTISIGQHSTQTLNIDINPPFEQCNLEIAKSKLSMESSIRAAAVTTLGLATAAIWHFSNLLRKVPGIQQANLQEWASQLQKQESELQERELELQEQKIKLQESKDQLHASQVKLALEREQIDLQLCEIQNTQEAFEGLSIELEELSIELERRSIALANKQDRIQKSPQTKHEGTWSMGYDFNKTSPSSLHKTDRFIYLPHYPPQFCRSNTQ